jgi:hypothetical protein
MLKIQTPRRATAAVALLLASAAWLPADPQEKPVPNELPRSWDLDAIAKETPPLGSEGRVYVLAWKVVEDERPLRVESCLVLKVLAGNEGYCLAHLYRHPAQKPSEWHLGMTHVTGKAGTKYFPGLDIMHVKRFKARPSNREVYAALSFEEVNWSFELTKSWKLVSCGVCEKSWQEAIGEQPTHFFEPADGEANLLQATLSLGKDGKIDAVFRNGSNRQVKIDKQVIESSILGLEVRDASGRVLYTVSPPVPSARPEQITLPPGKEHAVSYRLEGFDPPLVAGKYRVRLRVPEWKSNELDFQVGQTSDPQKPDLTPGDAREALLQMMRSEAGKALGWFKGNIPDEMAKMAIEKKEDGWYDWTGAFSFNPSQAVYTFTVRPSPGARACIFEYTGTFFHKDGRWSATPPKLIRTVLQSGCSAATTEERPPEFTPDSARAALAALVREHPETFEVKYDADEEVAKKKIEPQGDGKYRVGPFHIDVPGKAFALYLVPAKDSLAACRITYQGTFVFTDGQWVAQRPKVTYAKAR